MTEAERFRRRVLLVVTGRESVPCLWRAALERLADRSAGLTAVYLADNRWQRVASLPFTREISRIGGAVSDFTAQRAHQLSDEAATEIREAIARLAAESELVFSFETLSAFDEGSLGQLFIDATSVLVAPAHTKAMPLYRVIERTGCQIVFVESPESANESQ